MYHLSLIGSWYCNAVIIFNIWITRNAHHSGELIAGCRIDPDLFCGSDFIHKAHIMSPLTSIINFRHFHLFLASYSKIPTQYFYYEKLLPGPMDTLNSSGSRKLSERAQCLMKLAAPCSGHLFSD